MHGFLHDEQGDKSAGRAFLLGCLIAEFVLVVARPDLPAEAFHFFEVLDGGIITWITGRAIASRFGGLKQFGGGDGSSEATSDT